MTKNERYVVKGSDDFFLHIEDTTLTEDKHEGTIDNIYQVVNRLNEQDNEIQRLKKVNRGLQFKIIDMLDFVKEKGTVTREEIKNWWNGDNDG